MMAARARWEIWTDLSKDLGSDAILICRFEVAETEVSRSALDLEQTAGDFIARQVLERDAVFFEG